MGQYGGLFNICWAVLGRTRLVPGMFYGVFGVTAIRAPGRRLMFYVDCVFMAVHQHVYVHSHVGGWGGTKRESCGGGGRSVYVTSKQREIPSDTHE